MITFDLAIPSQFMEGLKQSPYNTLTRVLDLIETDLETAKKILIPIIQNAEYRLTKEEIETLFTALNHENYYEESLYFTGEKEWEGKEQDLLVIGQRWTKTRLSIEKLMEAFQYRYIWSEPCLQYLGLRGQTTLAFNDLATRFFKRTNFLNLTALNLYNKKIGDVEKLVARLLAEREIEEMPRLQTLLERVQRVLKKEDLYKFISQLVYKLPENQVPYGA